VVLRVFIRDCKGFLQGIAVWRAWQSRRDQINANAPDTGNNRALLLLSSIHTQEISC